MGEGEEEAEEDASRVYMEGMREEVGLREARPEATVLCATFLSIMASGVERVRVWTKPECRAYETRAIGQARVIWLATPPEQAGPATPHLYLRSTTISSKTTVPTL